MEKTLLDSWEAATWEGARRAQLRAFAALSFREQMERLEEACDLVRRFNAQAHAEGRPYLDPRTGAVVHPASDPHEGNPPPAGEGAKT